MEEQTIKPMPQWESLNANDISGVVLILGGVDAGKSTFARYLFKRLRQTGKSVAYLDGDPGQSTLAPPTTLTLALPQPGEQEFPPRGETLRYEVGSVTPVGHMLPMLAGYARLISAAREKGFSTIICDTTGLIDPEKGGLYLKLAKIDLLRPTVVVGIQREKELEPLLYPLRRSRRVKVIQLPPSSAVIPRDLPTRQAYRAQQYAAYFSPAKPIQLYWHRLAVFPRPLFRHHQIVSLEDVNGFSLGLGIVLDIDPVIHLLTLNTPVRTLDQVDALRLADVAVDPDSFLDRMLNL